jgi:AcrR family transcriptional regulator
MPRPAGSIDLAKSEAILDAAAELLAERGLAVSIEEIARRAGVSKQTVYNRFGTKLEIARAMAERRADAVTEPLIHPPAGADPESVLCAYAERALEKFGDPRHASTLRAMMSAASDPELGHAVYEAGPLQSRRRLAAWLAAETKAGRLSVDEPDRAAEMFSGMVMGHRTIRTVLGVASPETEAQRRVHAKACASRFVRAFAP